MSEAVAERSKRLKRNPNEQYVTFSHTVARASQSQYGIVIGQTYQSLDDAAEPVEKERYSRSGIARRVKQTPRQDRKNKNRPAVGRYSASQTISDLSLKPPHLGKYIAIRSEKPSPTELRKGVVYGTVIGNARKSKLKVRLKGEWGRQIPVLHLVTGVTTETKNAAPALSVRWPNVPRRGIDPMAWSSVDSTIRKAARTTSTGLIGSIMKQSPKDLPEVRSSLFELFMLREEEWRDEIGIVESKEADKALEETSSRVQAKIRAMENSLR